MMKHVIFSSTLAALLLLSGCSSKEPTIDASADQAGSGKYGVGSGSANGISPDGVGGIDGNGVMVDANGNPIDANEQQMMTVEKEMKDIYFDFDQFNIRPDMQANMQTDIQVANDQGRSYMIKVEGNCDEWGSDEYNYALGLKRANSVKDAMVQGGVDANRITMVSLGESNPKCTESNHACWADNRRVEFKLLP